MLTQQEWALLVDPNGAHWKERYQKIATQVHAILLADKNKGTTLDTYTLACRLFPDHEGTEAGKAFARLIRILQKDSLPVEGWFTITYGRNRFNGQKNIKRRNWHAPDHTPIVQVNVASRGEPRDLMTIYHDLAVWYEEYGDDLLEEERNVIDTFLLALIEITDCDEYHALGPVTAEDREVEAYYAITKGATQ